MENEELKKEETGLVSNDNFKMTDFTQTGVMSNSDTQTDIITNIHDEKKLFNLENNVDCLLNDCEGELIRVKEVLIKRYYKPLKNPVINEETGEIEKEYDITMSCVLVDDKEKSYATGSKVFTIQLLRLLDTRYRMGSTSETFDIKIIKKKFFKIETLQRFSFLMRIGTIIPRTLVYIQIQ